MEIVVGAVVRAVVAAEVVRLLQVVLPVGEYLWAVVDVVAVQVVVVDVAVVQVVVPVAIGLLVVLVVVVLVLRLPLARL